MRQEIDKIWKILHRHESKIRGLNWEKVFRQFFKRKLRTERQKDQFRGVHLALCVDTRDPWKQNRVRWFSPSLHITPAAGRTGAGGSGTNVYAKINQLDWAWPISPMGGIDDSGMTWVPPPGSTLCLLFQHGDPGSAFYVGTHWQRDKGPENSPNWGYDIPEYNKIFRGHRKGNMVGKNDESQSKPPFDCDNYQGYDIDTTVNTSLVPDAQNKTTWPHIYGWKTPEKHMVRMDDGDPKCNRRWKRFEIMSSMGHYFLMKDDPYHHCGEWVNPKCKVSFVDIVPVVCNASTYFTSYTNPSTGIVSFIAQPYPCEQGPENCPTITETTGLPVEQEYLGTEHLCPTPSTMPSIFVSYASYTAPQTASSIPVDCMGVIKGMTDFCFQFNNDGKNKYHKQQQECFPFLSDHCALQQSGMQLLARSGATFVMDDSVEEPRERTEWERTLRKFDMDGCTGVFKGRTFIKSATGHYIEFNDHEVNPKVRGPRNGINIVTACGNSVVLCDHSKEGCVAGELRGVHIRSTADHTLDMVDDGNQQCSGERRGCSKPGPYSKKAYVRLRSGYGLTLTMNDAQDQTKTDQQYIQLLAPQKDNQERGPHMLHMQERPTGSGQIFLRAGGDYVVYTYDHMVEVVGDENMNPSNKLEFISKMKVVSVKDVYYNKAKTHVFWADDYVFLLAGKDCASGLGPDAKGTCVYPVVVATGPIPEFVSYQTNMKASEHVFASAINDGDDPCSGLSDSRT